jgi:outer membrane protein TolC
MAAIMFGTSSTGAWASEPALGLSALLERAEAENPDLRAAQLRWEAAQEKSGYAGALEAPRLTASLMDIRTLGGPSITVSQMIPGGSKRALMTEAAQREAAMAEAELAKQRLQVASELRQAYYEHAYLKRAQAIYQQTLEQVRNLRKIADAKYAVGSGLQQDPIRAQRELSMLLDKGLTLDAGIASSRAWANTLANRSAMAAIQVPKDLPALPPIPAAADLMAKAEANSPALRAAQEKVKAEEATLRVSQQDRGTPDFEVGVEAGRSMPGDMAYIGGMVGINLPWLSQGRYEGAIRSAEAGLAAAQATYQAEKNRLQGEIYRVIAELERQERQVQLYKQGLLPQARQALQSALAAYQVSKVDFDTVLESQTAIYQVQTDEARAKADFHQTLAKLEALVGVPLSSPAKGS